MAEEGSEDQSETGGSLRAKLEASNAENREMAAELRSFKAAKEIADKGYKHVTLDDLKDVSLTELSAKAAELETKKTADHEVVLRQVLAAQGYDGDALDTAVSQLLNPEESHNEVSTRLASLGRISGGAPGAHDTEGRTGRHLIEAGLEENAEKAKKLRR